MKKISYNISLPLIILCIILCCAGTAAGCKGKATDGNTDEFLCGGFTEQREITDEEEKMFRDVIGTIDTCTEYTPLSVSTQVVSGLNYRFRCLYDDKTGNAPAYCHVTIYKPLQGNPELLKIEKQ